VAMGSEGYNRFWRFYKNGHVMLEPMTQDYTRVKGLGERSQGMLPGMKPGEFRLVGLFPDTIVVCRSTVLGIGTLNPIAPNLSFLESRGLGIKGESPKDRAMRVKHHNQYWGPFGRNAPEDALIPELVCGANRCGAGPYGLFARHEGFRTHDDETVRAFYDQWGEMVGRAAHDPYEPRTGRAAAE